MRQLYTSMPGRSLKEPKQIKEMALYLLYGHLNKCIVISGHKEVTKMNFVKSVIAWKWETWQWCEAVIKTETIQTQMSFD